MAEREEPGSRTSGAQIVVIEDHPLEAALLRFLLEREGHVVTTVAEGRSARTMIAAMAPPDLALVDIDLPYHDGFELIQDIRGHAPWADLPVFVLSSKGSERDISRAFDLGADDYIVKPFQPEELKARIRRRLRLNR